MDKYLDSVYQQMKGDHLIENHLNFNTDEIELNLFETKKEAFDFRLQFNDLSLISMVKGKKVMHFDDKQFDFLPNESLILNKNKEMVIDFPEAQLKNPTRCIALIISPDKINQTLDLLNENHPRLGHTNWQLTGSIEKLNNDDILQQNIRKIIAVATSERLHKKALSKLATQELIINLLQTDARKSLLNAVKIGNQQLDKAIDYIRNNIDKTIDIEQISGEAMMSKSTFFRHFKNEFGITPNDFILGEKIKKSKIYLRNLNRSITDIAFSLAFSSTSHFIQVFKKITGTTPKKYRQIYLQKN